MKRPSRLLSVLLLGSLVLSGCGGGGSSGGSQPTPTPTPIQSADACPQSGASPSSVGARPAAALSRHAVARMSEKSSRYVPGIISVTYAKDASSDSITRSMASYALQTRPEVQFNGTGLRSRTFVVDPSRESEAIAKLRQTAGVKSVEQAQYRHRLQVSPPNDPYYAGLIGAPGPYFETNNILGQWDMHAMNMQGAWSLFPSAPIAGAPIAVIDTGVDVTLQELMGGKITRTECFVTYPSNAPQSTSVYVTDTDGHGTNVAGIADADTGNGFGFAGVAWSAPLLAYRIFPSDPSSGCEGSNANLPQCQSTDVDEVSAINDAVANGAKVINLSLGATGPLSSCQDSIEETAVENAISAGVVVVAAAGNDATSYLGCPAAYPGVIAAGASWLDDSGATPVERFASDYSDYTVTQPSGGGAYLLAPGGEVCHGQSPNCNDPDDLHWIANITSSQVAGNPYCVDPDQAGESDCEALFVGTSQATPHIAGVVSLMLAANPNLTPAQIATGLCHTADVIPTGGPRNPEAGCGRVNAGNAVSWAQTH